MVAYEKTDWQNGGPNRLNATNLDKIESQLSDPITRRSHFAPVTSGLFYDFRHGAPLVPFDSRDPAAPHWLDAWLTDKANGGQAVYATDQLPPPGPDGGTLPAMLRITSTGTAKVAGSFGARTYPKMTEHWDGTYFYLDDLPATNIRLVSIDFEGNARFYLRYTAATRKLEVLNAALAVVANGTSPVALDAATHYRIAFFTVHGAAGTFLVKVYAGHALVPLFTFTAGPFDTGAYCNGLTVGNINNTNLTGHRFRIGGLFAACDAEPGPHTGISPARAHAIVLPDGSVPYEVLVDGSVIHRAGSNLGHDLGAGFQYQQDDEMLRVTPDGFVLFGPNRLLGNPKTFVNSSYIDSLFDPRSGRLYTSSLNSVCFTEPPDLSQSRIEAVMQETGVDASSDAGTSTISIHDVSFSGWFTWDRGKRLTFDGVTYTVTQALETSVVVDPAPPTLSNKAWSLDHYPYPRVIHGCRNTSAGGQWRAAFSFYPFKRGGASGATADGLSPNITITGFAGVTAADLSRGLVFNNDPGLGIFYVVTAVGNAVTLDRTPAAFANVAWGLFGADVDGGGFNPGFAMGTAGWKAASDCAQFAASGQNLVGGIDFYIGGADPRVAYTSGQGTGTGLWVRGKGDVELARPGGRLGYGPVASGLGAAVTQLTSKATGVTINKATGKITLHNQSLAAGAIASFVVTNSVMTNDDVVIINLRSGAAAAGTYRVMCSGVGNGNFVVDVQNVSGGPLAEALILNFAIIRGQDD